MGKHSHEPCPRLPRSTESTFPTLNRSTHHLSLVRALLWSSPVLEHRSTHNPGSSLLSDPCQRALACRLADRRHRDGSCGSLTYEATGQHPKLSTTDKYPSASIILQSWFCYLGLAISLLFDTPEVSHSARNSTVTCYTRTQARDILHDSYLISLEQRIRE